MAFSLRYAVTTSPATLPTAAVVCSLVWLFGGIGEGMRWVAWLVTLITMFAVMHWNSQATLIRQRTRMASTSFIVLLTAFAFLEPWSPSMVAALCYVLTHIVLSHCYQNPKSQGWAFHAFLLLATGSLCFRPILLLAPFFILSMAVQLQTFTWRTFMAAIIGLATPYWLILAWNLTTGSGYDIPLWQAGDFTFGLISPASLDTSRKLSLFFLLVYIAIAMLDYMRTYYQDKIRTRMFIYMIMVQLAGLGLMLLFLPSDFDSVMRLICCCAAPLIGHHLTLARGRFVRWYFIGTLTLVLLLIIYTRV